MSIILVIKSKRDLDLNEWLYCVVVVVVVFFKYCEYEYN